MPHTLTLVQMNDSHAYFEPHQELFLGGNPPDYRMAGGYARISTLLNQIREEQHGSVLAFDCGDTIHGTYAAVKTQGEALIPILNQLQFDGMTAHWDFAYGPAQLKKIVQQLQYPLLAINCYDTESGNLLFIPATIRDVGGIQVGVIGIASNISQRTMPKPFQKEVSFTLGNQELPRHIEELHNERVDLIVVLSHLGLPQDIRIAEEVEGIDVLLSGHTHNRLRSPLHVNNTTIIQSGSMGSFLGRLDLTVDNHKVRTVRHQLITVEAAIQPDPLVQELVNKALDPYRTYLNAPVGTTATALNRNTMLEATMDNFLLQALTNTTGREIAFSNGWRYGAPVIPGTITRNDLWNIIPTNPPISTVELRGEEIHRMMEENFESTFSRDPYEQKGGYTKRCLGMTVYCKIENPNGYRIQEIFVHGERLDPLAYYQVVFVTNQGVPSNYGKHRVDLDIHAIDSLEDLLNQGNPIRADLEGSIIAI